jgi:N-acetyltransferase 10
MGYGSRALQVLNSFYSGEYFNLNESIEPEPSYPDSAAINPVCSFDSCFMATVFSFFYYYYFQNETLLTEYPTIRPASAMPPLLQRLTERKPEVLEYLGVSYGLTPQLLR